MKQSLAANTVISHYRVASFIGAGGIGEVYLAQDATLGSKMALMILSAQYTKDEDRVRRFQHEARAASALNHPNILTIYEIGQTDDLHYIATEYIDGQTLRKHLSQGRRPLGEVLEIGIQIASALAEAHAAGITHRDIKPENIMIRQSGLVKVLDFGLAKLAEKPSAVSDSDAVTLGAVDTGDGVIVGTCHYMSPEQVRGMKVDARSDIFSLGIVLH